MISFGVCLIGVFDVINEEFCFQLNLGLFYKLKIFDYCFYIGEFKEEFFKVKYNNVIYEEIMFVDKSLVGNNSRSLGRILFCKIFVNFVQKILIDSYCRFIIV